VRNGGCVPSSQPPCTGPSDVDARVSYPLAAFATHEKRGREERKQRLCRIPGPRLNVTRKTGTG